MVHIILSFPFSKLRDGSQLYTKKKKKKKKTPKQLSVKVEETYQPLQK